MPDLDSLHERIARLDDQQAPLVLQLLVEHDRLYVPADDWDSARNHLKEAIAGSDLGAYVPPPGTAYSNGDLARTALLYYAEAHPDANSTINEAITYIKGPAERFDIATLALGALVLAALQTEIKLERDTQGKWTFRLQKKAVSDSTLGKVITTFIGYLTNSGK
jgi:hypothetical protein